ncbi:MAG TPA: hypothetical protein VF230_14790 [Acidimicrobiales bacterium]
MRARLLVLTVGHGSGAAVDLGTGALLRLHWPVGDDERGGERGKPALAPFDIVEVDARNDDGLPFPLDSVVAAGEPVPCGRLTGRRAERLLRPLVHPVSQPLLGGPTPTVPYWTLRDDQPTIALVDPSAGPVVQRDARLSLRCRFRWRRLDHDLPLDDPTVEQRLSHPTCVELRGGTLARALGWRPHRLVVALAPPDEGLCQKVVAGLLPKP